MHDPFAPAAGRVERNAELLAVPRECVELLLGQRILRRVVSRRDVVIHRRDCQVGASDGPAREPKRLERLRRRDLVNEVEIDVQEIRQALRAADDVVLPDLVEQCATHASTLARIARIAERLSGFCCKTAYPAPMAVRADEPTDAPLRRDVRLLGDLLGRVLVEQDGQELLDDVERVRSLARAARAGAPHEDLTSAVTGLPLERQASVLRAFATYFQLANVAEQQHRIRRRRTYAHEERVLSQSLGASFAQLDGVPAEEIERHVDLRLVLTAHPTEAARRTVLTAHMRIAARLAELDDPLLAPTRRDEIESELAAEITTLWQN